MPIEFDAKQVNVPPSCSLCIWIWRISVWFFLILRSEKQTNEFLSTFFFYHNRIHTSDIYRYQLDFHSYAIQYELVDERMFDILIELYYYIQLVLILQYLDWRFQVELKYNQKIKYLWTNFVFYQEFQVEIQVNQNHIHLQQYISIFVHHLIEHLEWSIDFHLILINDELHFLTTVESMLY